MTEFTAPWAGRVTGVSLPADKDLPDDSPGVNIVLNRLRLARWLAMFEEDRDLKDFLLIDAIVGALDIPVSSTGVIGSGASLGLRAFRLWEYCWIYKCLGLAKGGLKVLDIGGSASHLSLLTALSGNRIQCVDLNSEFVEAGNRASQIFSIPHYSNFVGDGRDLSVFARESFDAVICCSVLEHLTASDQRVLLDQAARVLRPGGLVGLTFDYGPGAPGANEHLPPPHDPPGSASEVFARYEVGGLQIVGNRDLEEPIAGSLFPGELVRYTIASVFLSRSPFVIPETPVPVTGESRLLEKIQIPNLIARSFDACAARYKAENESSQKNALEPIKHHELALERESQLKRLLQQQLGAAEARLASAESLIAQHEQEILELEDARRVHVEELERLREQTKAASADSSRNLGLIKTLENTVAELEIFNRRYEADIDEYRRTAAAVEVQLQEAQVWRTELDRTRGVAVNQAAKFNAARLELESGLAQLRDSLRQSEDKVAALHAELVSHLGNLHTLASESPFKIAFRRFLERMPSPANRYVLHPVPRFISPAAFLAIAHRFVNIAVSRYVRRYNPPPISVPRITIVTPVYNGEDYVGRAIESVLDQQYPNLEYFVEDGASTDRTIEIVERYRDRLAGITSQPDLGMYDAIGRGLARGTGEIFCYLNSDDVLLPGALFRIGEYFARNPDVDVIYHEDVVDVNGWRYPNVAQTHVGFNLLLNGHILFQDGVFFRRRAYEAAGGFNRDLKLAGDWDLWTRMARRSRFRRLQGHRSCFYIRGGQLSSRMDEYKAEMEQQRVALKSALKFSERLRHRLENLVLSIRNRLERPPDRLFFPIDFSEMPPPPGQLPQRNGVRPCPITGILPSRLLFSSRDTRFGFPLVNDFHYVPESHLAICDPALSDEFLGSLYELYYSQRDPQMIPPDPQYGSPYRLYRGPGLVLRFVRNILAPLVLSRLVRLDWDDQTASELIAALKSARAEIHKPLSFLDVGCFKGYLLDTLKQRTVWNLHGVEINPEAAKEACAKGHNVLTAAALDAVFVFPADQRFDVIFLGQVIEHLSDPVRTVRRLSMLLKPHGKLVLTTPNLDSRQIDLFGPASSHWHPPYHRHIFSVKALKMMAKSARLRIDFTSTHSHPYWTALSLWLNNMGLGASVPHGIELPGDIANHARSITTWSKLFWDRRGKGDYICIVFSKE